LVKDALRGLPTVTGAALPLAAKRSEQIKASIEIPENSRLHFFTSSPI
jgi:hypothetical protein